MHLKPGVLWMIMFATMTLHGCLFDGSSDEATIPENRLEQYRNDAGKAASSQQYDLAEKNYLMAIKEYEKDGSKSSTTYGDLSKIYVFQGRYDEALTAESICFQRRKKELALYEIFWHYRFVEEINQAQGKFDEARKAVEWLIENGDRGLREAEAGKDVADIYNAKGNKYWTACPAIGNFYLQLGEYEKAIPYLKEHVDHAIKGKAISQTIAEAKNRLALAYYYAGNDTEAEKLFREAGGLNARAMVGFPVDLAQSLTMLAKIAGHRGQTEQALKFFQSARDALHMYRTLVFKVEESDILGQLGRYQLQQGKLAEAGSAYQQALALRRETQTESHPNCADAIKGLADVAAIKGELTSATLQATEALKILDAAVVPTHPRLAPELVALASIHKLAGEPEKTGALEARLEAILHKPLGPWKEDFLETRGFYVGLLKKAGKTAEAERLERMQPRG